MNEMIKLAVPVVMTYLGMMTMGLVDLLAVGRVGAVPLGAVGVGVSIFSWFLMFGLGLLMGLDYLISHAYGAGDREECHRAWAQGVILSVAISIPLTAAMFLIADHLEWLKINEEVARETAPFLKIIACSLLPLLLFTACRQQLQAMGVAKPAMVILIAANVVNALVNYVLVFGNWGAPALGATGSGFATLISRVWMMLAMGGYLIYWDRVHGGNLLAKLPFRFDARRMKRLIILGFPSAMQMLFEVGVFALSTTLAARLTAPELAAHQIVLNMASFTFMVPLGIGSATAVLVGQALGRGESSQAVRVGWRGIRLATGFMTLTCVLFLSFPDTLLHFYTGDSKVVEIGKGILLIAALFQLSDGAQTVATGALRGMADTRRPALANLGGHWLVGLPVGVYLCFEKGWGLQGIWIGLSLGLTLVAVVLVGLWGWMGREKELILRRNALRSTS